MDRLNFKLRRFVWVLCFGVVVMGCYCQPVYGQRKISGKAKVALIYTVTTPELIADTEREVREQLGENVEIITYQAPSVFEEIRQAGYVTAAPAAKMIRTYMEAIETGADAILSICSTVGDVAFATQDVAKYLGVPIILINEEMCREAVRMGNSIAVMATFPTAIDPTVNIIRRVAREMGKHDITVTSVLVADAFGLAQEQFKQRMAAEAEKVATQVDVIVFAQGSMAYCEQYIADRFQKTVLSNPRFGAKALKTALQDKGLIEKHE